MNWNWKDYFIVATLGIIIILAMFKLVDWTIEKDSSIGVVAALGFIGAILGGALSGAITLIGVKLTIAQQTKLSEKEEQRIAESKFLKLQFINTEVAHLITNVQTGMLSFRHDNYEENVKLIYQAAERLGEVSKGLFSKASEVDVKLLKTLKNISWTANYIKEFIDEAAEKDYDEKYVINELRNGGCYKRLAMTDYELWNTVNSYELIS